MTKRFAERVGSLDWGKLAPLRLRARAVAEGVYAGAHRSRRRGPGVEFGGHRSYVPGDDLRFLDRRATMRHGKLLVRQFETETDRGLRLVVDASHSMAYRSDAAPGAKLAFAALVGAALCRVALASADTVSLDFIGGEHAPPLPAMGGLEAFERLTEILAAVEPSGDASASVALLDAALDSVARRSRRGTAIIVLSDFIDLPEGAAERLAALCSGGKVVVGVRVLDPVEVTFPFTGPVLLRASEGGANVETDGTSARTGYLSALAAKMASYRDRLVEQGGRFVEVTTTDDPVLVVQGVLAAIGGTFGLSFVVWAALAIAGLVVGPIVAHLLHLGRAREREFPPAALVPPHRSTARERSRLEDYPLLVLRSLLVVGLALLGATPLVRCDHLALGRTSGASVALAIVLDDSSSMRASLESGKTRWDVAKTGAEQLLHSAREGDAIAIVLAGRPARIALAPTTDLGAAERALGELSVSDRSTDLRASVELARAALKPLPQRDHRLVVLSDLADDPIGEGSPPVSVPLTELSTKVNDCAITSVERRGTRVTATVACSTDVAAHGRSVELVVVSEGTRGAHAADGGARRVSAGDVAARAELSPRRGEQSLALSVPREAGTLNARLTGADACRRDDEAPVSEESTASVVGVVADATRAAAKTGGPTVVEQALQALGDAWVVRPLPFVPDDEKGLDGTSALVIDDPPGFSPEARASLARFLSRGGVAAALLGPRSAATALGWTLEPFGRGAARWEEAKELRVDTGSLSWLGTEAASFDSIARRGRTRLDGMEMSGARVNGRWTDGVPFLLERAAERGLAVTVGLPASLDESDLALRPGFIALLDHLLRQASQREGGRRTTAGGAWTFPSATEVSVQSPDGRTPVSREPSDEACAERGAPPGCGDTVLRAIASVGGRYAVRVDGATETRIATLDPAEILADPRPPPTNGEAASVRGSAHIGVSRELSLVLVALFAAEVAVRLFRKWTGRRTTRARVIPNP